LFLLVLLFMLVYLQLIDQCSWDPTNLESCDDKSKRVSYPGWISFPL